MSKKRGKPVRVRKVVTAERFLLDRGDLTDLAAIQSAHRGCSKTDAVRWAIRLGAKHVAEAAAGNQIIVRNARTKGEIALDIPTAVPASSTRSVLPPEPDTATEEN